MARRHYGDVIMSSIASQITSLTTVYSTVYSGTDQRKHQSSASLAFVRGIHRGPVNSPHKWPVTRKMFPFDDVIMRWDGGLDGVCRHSTKKLGVWKYWCLITQIKAKVKTKICTCYDNTAVGARAKTSLWLMGVSLNTGFWTLVKFQVRIY